MHKINIGVIALTILLLIANVTQAIVWRGINKNNAEMYTKQVVELEQSLAAYGTPTTCYTVVNSVKAGDMVTEDVLETVTIPSASVTDQHVTESSSIVGRVFKIAVNPGTPLTKNMTMEEVIEDDVRDRDIVLDRVTVGVTVGDYIDIRITFPYGDDYVVIPHKRVYGVNDNTLKLYMSEFDWMQYQGAMVDYYLNQPYGATIYADKYVEPGIQQAAVKYYAVPTNIAALIQKDPNVLDKKDASDLNSWRSAIEELLVIFRDEEDTVDSDGTKFATGRSEYNEKVVTDMKTAADIDQEEQESSVDDQMISDDFWSDDVEPAVDAMDDAAGTGGTE